MLPVTVLSTDGTCDTKSSSNILYKNRSSDIILDLGIGIDGETKGPTFVALLLHDRSLVLHQIKLTNQNLVGGSSVLRNSGNEVKSVQSYLRSSARRPGTDAGSSPASFEVLSSSRLEPPKNLDKWPTVIGALTSRGMWVQRADGSLLVFADVSLGLAYTTHRIYETMDALNALEVLSTSSDHLVLSADGVLSGYKDIGQNPAVLNSAKILT